MEHLLPHKNGKYLDRKFDWNNLFWACGHCNNVKIKINMMRELLIVVKLILKR